MLYNSNFVLDIINLKILNMKRIYLPLLAIAAVLAITGIEIFQVDPVNSVASRTGEIMYVIMLTILFGLGVILLMRRSRELKMGLPAEDELSRQILNKAGSITFFISLLIWLILLYIEVHNIIDTEERFLFSFGIIAVCFVFLISWTVMSFSGAGHEKQD